MWNKDEIKGKGKQISGAIKDKAGELIKNPKLEAKGEAERGAGKIQEKSGKALRKTGEAVQKVGKTVTGKR
ncbi:MAG: CsbD family protein [Candidatus Binatia bacterium]